MAEDANWKQVDDVLKTEGNILEIGSFISRSGNKVDISEEDADMLFNNIDSRLPFVVLHDDGYQEEVGYATKFERNSTGIAHKGLIFTNPDVKNAVARGYSISSEIDYRRDEFGKVVDGKIVKLAFVPNPAMKQTSVDITRFAFSAPEVNSMTQGTPQNNTPDTNNATSEPTVNIQGQEIPVSAFVDQQSANQTPAAPSFDQALLANIASTIAEGVAAKFNTQLEAMQQELATLRAAQAPTQDLAPAQYATVQGNATPPAGQVPPQASEIAPELVGGIPKELFEEYAQLRAENQNFRSQIEKEERSAYTSKLAELRALGQDNPEKLVSHLKDTRSKIETLDALKVALVKNTPMNSPQNVPLGVEGGKNQSIKQPTVLGLAESLRISIDADTASKLAQRMRIPLQ